MIDPSAVEHNRAAAKTLLVSLLTAHTGAWELLPAHVEVQIVDRRTDEVVFTRKTQAEVARLLAVDADKGLDRLGAADFAREWGIGVEAAPSPTPWGLRDLLHVPGILYRMLLGRDPR